MIDDPQHDEGVPQPGMGAGSHTSAPYPDDHAPGGDELTSGRSNKARPSASSEGRGGAGKAAGAVQKVKTESRELETTRTEQETPEDEEMTNDSALPGLVSEDIGGAGAALNSML